MSELSNPSEIIANYAAGPRQLETALAGLAETDLDVALSSANWTIRQMVHHIADGDDIWKEFIKRAIGQPQGEYTLAWYWQIPQDEWAKRWAYSQRDISPSLALFRANRQHIAQLLAHLPDAWEKSFLMRWPDGEEEQVSVGEIVTMQAQHVTGHIEDIRQICQAHHLSSR
jgi:uncharacterized damage-inducible protein DinB